MQLSFFLNLPNLLSSLSDKAILQTRVKKINDVLDWAFCSDDTVIIGSPLGTCLWIFSIHLLYLFAHPCTLRQNLPLHILQWWQGAVRIPPPASITQEFSHIIFFTQFSKIPLPCIFQIINLIFKFCHITNIYSVHK